MLEFKSGNPNLNPHASAVLIDSEFGSGAFAECRPSCGLLTTYEMDGYENPRPHRMLALMPDSFGSAAARHGFRWRRDSVVVHAVR